VLLTRVQGRPPSRSGSMGKPRKFKVRRSGGRRRVQCNRNGLKGGCKPQDLTKRPPFDWGRIITRLFPMGIGFGKRSHSKARKKGSKGAEKEVERGRRSERGRVLKDKTGGERPNRKNFLRSRAIPDRTVDRVHCPEIPATHIFTGPPKEGNPRKDRKFTKQTAPLGAKERPRWERDDAGRTNITDCSSSSTEERGGSGMRQGPGASSGD